MNPDKLEALRKLAIDERTPVEEARNAALVFVRNGGRTEMPKSDDQTLQLAVLEEQRDHAKAEAKKEKAEADRLRLLLGKMLALADAATKLEKNRAEVEAEVRRAVGQEPEKSRPTAAPYWAETNFVEEFMRQQTRRRY
jgi:hypothetical protein